MWTIDLSTAKPLLHFTLHVLADLMSAATEDQVTKTKLILYQSISDVVQITINIFPVYIHYPGEQKKSILLVRDVSTQNEKRKKKTRPAKHAPIPPTVPTETFAFVCSLLLKNLLRGPWR